MTGGRAELMAEMAMALQTWAGFRMERIGLDALAKVMDQELATGGAPEDLAAAIARRDPLVLHRLSSAASVGETFFFRHPEHFRFLTMRVFPAHVEAGTSSLSAWSAGCATGEEAYSLAACLRAGFAGVASAKLSVLGTDIVEANVAAAAQGAYRPWSVRQAGPMLHPVFEAGTGPERTVLPEIRKMASFKQANLLSAPPMGSGVFDVVFCRNVLIYFTAKARDAALKNVADSLAPGGVLVVGAVDVGEPPPGLEISIPGELQVFHKPGGAWMQHANLARPRPVVGTSRAVHKPALAPAATPAASVVPKDVPVTAPVAEHIRALTLKEEGRPGAASQALEALLKDNPEYVPGMLDLALLLMSRKDAQRATHWMVQVLRHTEGLLPEAPVVGPQALSVAYYRTAAEAFLLRREAR